MSFDRWRSLVDGAEIDLGSAIPDSDNLHAEYNLQEQPEGDGATIDTLIDQSDNGFDADAVGSPTMDVDGFDGQQAAVLDGANDGWDIPESVWESLDQPFTFYAVFSIDGESDDRHHIFDYLTDGSRVLASRDSDEVWRLNAGSSLDNSAGISNNVVAMRYDSTDSLSEIGLPPTTETGDGGTNSIEDVSIGRNAPSDSEYFEGRIMHLMWYDAGHDTETRDDVRSYLDSLWNLS